MRCAVVLVVLSMFAGWARAEESAVRPLRVVVFDHPPFAQKTKSGTWEGLAIDLWDGIASELNLPFEYVETTPDDAISMLSSGDADVVAGALGVSAARERVIDFTQPFLASPMAVATSRLTRLPHWTMFLRDVLDHGVTSILIVLVVSMLLFSLALWLVERRTNDQHFGGHPMRGFGSALWFAAVTLTTVGYGDKTPRTLVGRTIVFFWMFFGIFIVGVFTATLASSIAIARMQSSISQPGDLAHYRDGVLDGSLEQGILSSLGIPARSFQTVEEGLTALKAGAITAFVDNEATLRYLINRDYPGELRLDTLPATHISLALAVRPRLPQLEAINIALIGHTMDVDWSNDVTRWLGPPAD